MAGTTRIGPRAEGPRWIGAAAGAVGLALALTAAGCAGSGADDAAAATADEQVALAATTLPGPQRSTPPEPSTSPDAEEPLVTAAPDEHSEVGDVVRGFPEDLLPLPDDAVILVTSAVPVGDADVQEISLNVRTAMTPEELLDLYRGTLLEAGFTEVTGSAPQGDLALEVTFTRSGGDELVSLGILDDDEARTVSIGGRVRTEAPA